MERGSYIGSLLLHVGVIVLVFTGLPSLFKPPEPEEMPIAVELVNIAEQTRTPTPNREVPKPDAKPEPQVAEATPEPPKPEPPKPEPPKPPPPPPPAPPPPPPPPAPKPPEPKPEPAPKPPEPKPEPPKPEPPKAEQKKPPEPKPEPPKQVANAPRPKHKPEPPKKAPEQFDVNALLKTLKESTPEPKSDEAPKKQPAPAPQQVASSAPQAPLGPQLTTSEIDLIRRQIAECWNPPIGAKDAKDLVVEVYVAANPDGTIRDARVTSAHGPEPSFVQAAADSALRAVRNPRCTPLKLPPDKYERWKTFTLVFTPRDML